MAITRQVKVCLTGKLADALDILAQYNDSTIAETYRLAALEGVRKIASREPAFAENLRKAGVEIFPSDLVPHPLQSKQRGRPQRTTKPGVSPFI